MVETYIYFTVKLLTCGYVFYKIWIIVFNQRLFGLWDRIPVRPPKDAPGPVITVVTEKELSEVVGKTTITYLDDPELAAKIPAHTEKLEPSDFIGEEPDISEEEVESELSVSSVILEEMQKEQERFEVMDDLTTELDPDFSTGLTYEEMANAVGVLTDATTDEQKIIDAAKTIHNIKDTDLYEFITHQVSNQDNVESLMRDCLDEVGNPLSHRKSKRDLKEFDINSFV
ncbi:DUF4122 family protein [Bacteroides sp. 51]|uniref:DUF4122 family protein n=1 Tax=Bacteroides sp. 51 TaxID=2302938 RepID=UPI0013D31DC1|nr:DUF4122 family protein [Bacteroides sp. 51]NDV81545.1 DUF4122 domain-containing protein [Bacteroides sp. 51]